VSRSLQAPDRTDVRPDGWELVVGLEVHVELDTATKMFCGCPTDFGAAPNTRICAVCSGQPGSLPVVNAEAVRSATRLGLALNCDITERCVFHRKNYFYPDLPKNYQISQYDVPLCTEGWLEVETDGTTERIGIERVHMEEDTGKMEHRGGRGRLHGAEESLVDYNRAGIPLLECVSEPDIATPEQAQAYLRELQAIVRALGISDAKMEEGSMRCDANVSVRRPDEPFGTRCEIKNLNSVRSLGRAIAFEAERQIHLLEADETITQETRHWDEERGRTETLRRKEGITDYRYFPDPDLVPVALSVRSARPLVWEVASLAERQGNRQGALHRLPRRGEPVRKAIGLADAECQYQGALHPGLERLDEHPHASFFGSSVRLDLIAGYTRRDGVEPTPRSATARNGKYVVDRLGSASAVAAPSAVSFEYAVARPGQPPPVGDPHELQ
jgi:Asp-tRNA(Asn)/Glu-tRNA(Gln) amidotransferase B subunit